MAEKSQRSARSVVKAVTAAVAAALVVAVAMTFTPADAATVAARPPRATRSASPTPAAVPTTAAASSAVASPSVASPSVASSAVGSLAGTAPAIDCTYVVVTSWPGGFSADLYITNNTTTPIDGWLVRWTFDGATILGPTWSAVMTQTGTTIVATPLIWNPTIPPAGVAKFGWIAAAAVPDVPTDITINGKPC